MIRRKYQLTTRAPHFCANFGHASTRFSFKKCFFKPLPVTEKNYRGYLEVGILWSQQGSTRLFGLDSFKKLGDLSRAFKLRGRKWQHYVAYLLSEVASCFEAIDTFLSFVFLRNG